MCSSHVMSESSVSMIYVVCPSEEEAIHITRELLRAELISCGNILSSPAKSMFIWEGKLNEASEWISFFKTKTTSVSEAIALIKSIHSYKVPAILSWNIDHGYTAFLEWIERGTTKP